MLRNNKNWLRYRTLTKVREEHKELFDTSKKAKIAYKLEAINDKKSWWMILLGVVMLFVLTALVNLGFLNFLTISHKTATILVDQRTGNIAAITSITLVVVGFLISNLAIKEPAIYRLLFKHAYFYPIIYLILSTIACFIVISTLRDTVSPHLFVKLVTTGTYLSLFILVLIGFLFRTIIQFTNSEEIWALIRSELTRVLIEALVTEKSQEVQDSALKDLQVENFFGSEVNNHKDVVVKELNEYVVWDVNLKKVLKTISRQRKNTNKAYYPYNFLGSKPTNQSQRVFYIKEINGRRKIKSIEHNGLLLKKASKQKKTITVTGFDIIRKYLDDKLEQAQKDNDHKTLEKVLDVYKTLYELDMKLTMSPDELVGGINDLIYQVMRQSAKNSSDKIRNILLSFVRRVLTYSITYKNSRYFQQYIGFFTSLYWQSYQYKNDGNQASKFHEVIMKNIPMHLKEILLFNIIYPLKHSDNAALKQGLSYLAYEAFKAFSDLLFYIVAYKDFTAYKYALNEYDQITTNTSSSSLGFQIETAKMQNANGKLDDEIKALEEQYADVRQIELLKNRVLLGLKYWLIFLYGIKSIDEATAIEFIEITKVYFWEPSDSLENIFFFRSNEAYGYLGWSGWDYKERPTGKMYSPPNHYDWLTFGFLVDQIRNYTLQSGIDKFKSEDAHQIQFLLENLKEYSAQLQNEFDDWQKILKVDSLDDLQKKVQRILVVFESLKGQNFDIRATEIAATSLNQEKILEFKKHVGEKWKSNGIIRKLFNQKGNKEHISGDDIKLKCIGERTFFQKAKMVFIDGKHHQHIYGISDWGAQIGRSEDNFFFSHIIITPHNNVKASTTLEVFEQAIAKLKDKKVTPNLIIIPNTYRRRTEENNFQNSPLFKPQPLGVITDDLSNYLIGTFDGIPVYAFYTDVLSNNILICNFSEAFTMRYKTNDDWYEKELKVQVTEVTDEQAEKRLKDEPDVWKKTDNGTDLTDQEALTLIKTSVNIEVYTTLDYVIKSTDAYVVGYVQSDSGKLSTL